MSDTPLRKITCCLSSDLTADSAPDPPPDAISNSMRDSSSSEPVPLSWRKRLRELFPPNFESTSTSLSTLSQSTFTPKGLFEILINSHIDPHDTIVRSAWYCKQTTAARHEFIVIIVEDLTIQGLKTCLAIDRSASKDDSVSPGVHPAVTAVCSSTSASDAFRVSYDGDLKGFFSKSALAPYQVLERIEFEPGGAMPLLDLVTLVDYISKRHGKYNPVYTNCYWYAGLIWDCMCRICPPSEHLSYQVAWKKGRYGIAPTFKNPFQARRVVRKVHKMIEQRVSQPQNSNDSTQEAPAKEAEKYDGNSYTGTWPLKCGG